MAYCQVTPLTEEKVEVTTQFHVDGVEHLLFGENITNTNTI